MALTPNQRALRARLAAHALHARTDGRTHTRPARDAVMRRFEDQVDPDRQLTEEERPRRAQHALKAHMTMLALRSAPADGEQPDRLLRTRGSPVTPTTLGFITGSRDSS